jgi:glutathione S-transferase
MTETEIVLVGRSSSHFTRTARIFALELGVAHSFRPVLDMTTLDPATYAENPALKVPVLLDARGPLYGTENICRELALRSGRRDRVVLRGDVSERVVANAEEMILHAMAAEVTLISSGLGATGPQREPPPKVRPSLENALGFLEANVDHLIAALPDDRTLSFCETALYCLVTHLPFRKIMNVDGYRALQAFCARFGEREGARATGYRFDAAPVTP